MLFNVLASSAVGLAGLLIAAPAPVDALVARGSGSELGHLAARRLSGVSPNHHALARRKGNAHKKRQRCQQRPVSSTPASTAAPQQTGDGDYNAPIDVIVDVGTDNPVDTDNNDNSVTYPPNPTTTPPVTQPNIPPATGNGKLILAWPNNDDPNIPTDQYFTGKAIYYYTWSPFNVQNAGNVKFCPMLWGDHQINDFTRLVVPGYADCVLAMNEVNQDGQAKMDTDHGAYLWNTYIAPLADQGYNILGSPATTSAPNGVEWVVEWLNKISVKPNVITVHWYDVGFENFQAYVENFHDKTGQRTIWITEFACQNFNGGAQCDVGQVWDFVNRASAWMDQTEWIGGYAPFGFMQQMQGVNELNRLIDDQGHPTALGTWFVYNS